MLRGLLQIKEIAYFVYWMTEGAVFKTVTS